MHRNIKCINMVLKTKNQINIVGTYEKDKLIAVHISDNNSMQ